MKSMPNFFSLLLTINRTTFLRKGFTLIELLVVIAVIGVLAAIVLLAVNPAEQLARGRDANRISAVESLGKAMTNYITANNGTIQGYSATWQTTLSTAKEIANIISVPALASSCAPAVPANGSAQGNVCYEANAATAATDFVVWTKIESNNEKLKAGGGTACTSGNEAIIYFKYTNGKVAVGCAATSTGTSPITTVTGTYQP